MKLALWGGAAIAALAGGFFLVTRPGSPSMEDSLAVAVCCGSAAYVAWLWFSLRGLGSPAAWRRAKVYEATRKSDSRLMWCTAVFVGIAAAAYLGSLPSHKRYWGDLVGALGLPFAILGLAWWWGKWLYSQSHEKEFSACLEALRQCGFVEDQYAKMPEFVRQDGVVGTYRGLRFDVKFTSNFADETTVKLAFWEHLTAPVSFELEPGAALSWDLEGPRKASVSFELEPGAALSWDLGTARPHLEKLLKLGKVTLVTRDKPYVVTSVLVRLFVPPPPWRRVHVGERTPGIVVDAKILRDCLDALTDLSNAMQSPRLELARAFPRPPPSPSVQATPRESKKRWPNLNRPVFKVGGAAVLAVLVMKCPAETAVTTWQQANTSNFQQTDGKITEVPESDGSGIRYRYAAAGRKYSGTHISKLPAYEMFKSTLDRYGSGQHVPVYYASGNPQDSVLKRGLAPVAENIHILVFASIMSMLPILMVLVNVRMGKHSVRQRPGLTLLRLAHSPPLLLGLQTMCGMMFVFGMDFFVVRGDWWPWNACVLWPGVAIRAIASNSI